MISINDLKQKSRKNLEGKYFKYIPVQLITLVMMSISNVNNKGIEFICLTTVLGCLAILTSTIASYNIALEEDSFFPKEYNYTSIIIKGVIIGVLHTIAMYVGMFLFIIPGIILIYSYSQAIYILMDDNFKSPIDCLKESRQMMKGHKMELFMLEMSFLPMMILSVLTLGILYIWVGPQITVSKANFYLCLREEYLKKEKYYK